MSDPSWWFDRRRGGVEAIPPPYPLAKALAALNHPRIVTVYSVEEADGVHFITMELAKGKRLSELLPTKGFALKRFFEITIPLTDAVTAAHENGITHRDLKPDNVMVTDEGDIKVLDFGLAKPHPGFGDGSDPESPTALKTQGGIVGTVHYMSPEQAEGKTVDHRTDIFSLGIIFYELLTGERPFKGETPASVLSSIIKDEPPPLEGIPHELGRIVKRCLAKALNHRLQSARNLEHDLEYVRDTGERVEAVGIPRPRWQFVVGGVLLVALGGLLMSLLSSVSPASRVPRLVNPVRITTAVGLEDYPTWSPDGRAIAYTSTMAGDFFGGNWDIWVKQIGGGEAVNRTSDHSGADRVPSWSPDGTQIAFWSDRAGGGYYLMSALGGAPRKIVGSSNWSPSPPQWSRDSNELACVGGDVNSPSVLEIIDLHTRESRRLDLPGRANQRLDLAWSPDGELVAYVDATSQNADATRLVILRLAHAKEFGVAEDITRIWSPKWGLDARTLYFTSGRSGNLDLWQQSLGRDGTPEGRATPVTGGLNLRCFSLLRDGTKIAYSKGRAVGNLWRVPIREDRPATWSDAEQLTFDEAEIEGIDISPDGESVLFDSDRGGDTDLWILELEPSSLVQVTTDPSDDFVGAFSPDGQSIAFYSLRSGNRDIWPQRLDGGPAQRLTFDETEDYYPVWTPDGASLVYMVPGVSSWEFRWMHADGSSQRSLSVGGLQFPIYPKWSRQGNGLVFANWVESPSLWYQEELDAEPRRLTEKAGHYATWSLDGSEVYFIASGDRACDRLARRRFRATHGRSQRPSRPDGPERARHRRQLPLLRLTRKPRRYLDDGRHL